MADECPECRRMTLHKRTRRLHYFNGEPGDLAVEVVCLNCGFQEQIGVVEEYEDEDDEDEDEDEDS